MDSWRGLGQPTRPNIRWTSSAPSFAPAKPADCGRWHGRWRCCARRAVVRGLRVRQFTDDGGTVAGAKRIVSLERRAGIRVRLFNPFVYRGRIDAVPARAFAVNSARPDFRMPNKWFVADDDAFAVDPIVRDLSATFDGYWNSSMAIAAQALSSNAPPDPPDPPDAGVWAPRSVRASGFPRPLDSAASAHRRRRTADGHVDGHADRLTG